ncbi:FHA domain-containing protein [Nannocystis punicea]|uniref:FHA domain-containing protein n=1 Tax=Nannocystis punicea TaxID=2995304 RepID=A0ABY7GVE9_9BACT|nr:FHA domain-containing protein [Nannocystis poenicansa]WAS90917.1 FHA domain-containing protein [Nannocystis poenicansa]
MGRLTTSSGDTAWQLRERNILGRSRKCTIQLLAPSVSGEHALLRWAGGHWHLQDLHSRNGVYVAGRRLAPDERLALGPGAEIGLGDPGGLVLVDAGPPDAFAVPEGGGAVLVAEAGLLTLPDPSDPATIYRGPHGWYLEHAGNVREVHDEEVVRIGDIAWHLALPESLPPTAEAAEAPARIADLRLHFAVRPDTEYVELVAFHGASALDFKARTCHYPLLLLARERLRHSRLAPAQQGWVLQEELLMALQVDRNQLYVDIHRLRQQFAQAGVLDAARIVERRPGTRQLRIGTAHLEIAQLDRPLVSG